MKKKYFKFISIVLIAWCGHVTWAQQIRALTVLIDFPDQPGFIAKDSIIPMMNQVSGYRGFNLNGSVRQYWSEVSAGKMDYTSEVVGWLRASQPRVNYETYAVGGLDKLLAEVLPQLENKNFTGLTLRSGTNEVYSLNVIVQGGWGEALRPVAFGMQKPIKIFNNGVQAVLNGGANSITDMGVDQKMSISNITHENGHSVFWWPEYYMWESRVGSTGDFDLMATIGRDPERNPTPPNPALRLQRGWISNVTSLNVTANKTFTVRANDMNQTFKYINVNNPREYFLVEAYVRQGRYAGLNDEGLAIWYVDEEGGLKLPVPSNYLRVKVIEADGLEQIAKGINSGDANDLFDKYGKATFSDFTVPNARWKDGSYSGLNITNISAIGTTMTFNVEVKNLSLNATVAGNGKILPSGIIRVNTGASQVLQLQPDLGYEVSRVIINGITTNYSSTSYTLNNITQNTTFKVEFRKASSGFDLPSPWQKIDFGANVQGEAYYKDGVFATKKYGWDIWNNIDNFEYIYQKLSGDGEIVAWVSEQDATSEWAKSGVMIREELTDDSKHAFMCITPYQGPAFQYRTLKAGNSENKNEWNKRDKWVKLKRAGNSFSGYYSSDGINWTLEGTATIPMNKDVFVGLASVASTDLAKNAAKFEKVKFTPATVSLLAKYNVPKTTSLPSKFGKYSKVLTLGSGGPNLSNVHNSIFNWNSQNNQLVQFSLETNNGTPRWYTGLEAFATHNLKQASPSITFNNTGFAGLNGTYYVNSDGDNLVLVEKTGAYALYFCNCTSAPARDDWEQAFEASSEQLKAFPSPFATTTLLDLSNRGDIEEVVVFDLSGNVRETFDARQKESIVIGQSYEAGIYLVKMLGTSKSEILKIVKE